MLNNSPYLMTLGKPYSVANATKSTMLKFLSYRGT